MAEETKSLKVYYCQPFVGDDQEALTDHLKKAQNAHGEHFPIFYIEGRLMQFRSLTNRNGVWEGVYAHLKDENIPVLDKKNKETLFELEDGEHFLLKSYFLYIEKTNTLVWQYDLSVGGISRAEKYLKTLFGETVSIVHMIGCQDAEKTLSQELYEVRVDCALPITSVIDENDWSHKFNEMINGFRSFNMHNIKLACRAERKTKIDIGFNSFVKYILNSTNKQKVRVRLSDSDAAPIELFSVPIKDEISVPIIGKIINDFDVFYALKSSYNDLEKDIFDA